MEEKKTEGISIRIPRINYWILLSIILAIGLVLSLIRGGITGKAAGVQGLSAQEAGDKAVDFINGNLVQPGTSASLISTEDAGSMYKVIFSYQGNQFTFYMTKDGKYLSQSAWDTSEKIATEQTQQQPQEIPKTDKPIVQLFVMSFCPYGIQAENAMKPVVDLLGSKVTIEPHFIVSVSGTAVSSLHGDYEAKEDMRQACILKNYGQIVFWNYVDYINNNCNKNNLDSCWKDAAKNASVDFTKIESCVTSEGLNLMKTEETLSNQNGVSGSPTLIINGVISNSGRTPEAYKQAICSAFSTQPSECSQTLSSTGSTTTGGCA